MCQPPNLLASRVGVQQVRELRHPTALEGVQVRWGDVDLQHVCPHLMALACTSESSGAAPALGLGKMMRMVQRQRLCVWPM